MRSRIALLLLFALFALALAAGCQRKVRVKLRVRSADSGLVSSSTAASAR